MGKDKAAKRKWGSVEEENIVVRYRVEFDCYREDFESILDVLRGYGELYKVQKEVK
jgi:hypothetical protein